jgi:antirestriction protein ArdC
MQQQIFNQVTQHIIQNLETGVMPWARPWTSNCGIPKNQLTGKYYRGFNVLMLWCAANTRGYESDRWLTRRQADTMGGNVQEGEIGTTLIFWRPVTIKGDTSSDHKTFPITKFFTVFNVDQVDGIDVDDSPINDWQPEAQADQLLKLANVKYGSHQAYYAQKQDVIRLPDRKSFNNAAGFYSTALHELAHWTGADHRLNRLGRFPYGSPKYCFEELIAEMGAAFLCSMIGIQGQLQHAEYISSWLEVLKSDNRAILSAASGAQKVVDFVSELSTPPLH